LLDLLADVPDLCAGAILKTYNPIENL
jgi:hypothetical protein